MRTALLLILLILTTGTIFAGTVGHPQSNYATTIYRVQDGLPEDIVQSIAETPDGYLWIGTSGGLVRFDGTHFVVFNSDKDPAFHENSVHCLAVSKDGSLWIGTEGSGLIHYRNGVFRAYTAKDGLTDTFVRAIAEDKAGTLWIGTNNGFFQLEKGRISRLDGTDALPNLAVNAIQEDSRGRLWIGGSRLMTIENGRFQEHPLPGDRSRNRIKSLLQTNDGSIWVGTVSGLYRSPDGTEPFHKTQGIHGTVRVLRQSADGTLWTSIVGQGGATYRFNEKGLILTPGIRLTGTIFCIFQDMEQNVWVGTQTGLIRYSKTPISILPLDDAKESDFGTLYLDSDGTLWSAATYLIHIHDGVTSQYQFPQLAGVKIRNIFRDREGTLWIGTDGSGLFHLVGGQAKQFTTDQGLVNNFIRTLLQARDGSMWIGTDEGVSHLGKNRVINYGIKEGLTYFSIRSMLQDHAGDLWIGTEQGLSHLRDGILIHDAVVAALRQEKIWAIHEDKDNGLWFGTRNHGLYRWKAEKLTHYGVEDGLASNGIYAILEDSAGHFWMSGPGGISLLNRNELDDYAEHHNHPLSLTFYSLSQEGESAQLFGGVQSAGCITPQGDVWFPSNSGPVHVSLAESQRLKMPSLAIDQVFSDGKQLQGSQKVDLSPGNNRLEISYFPFMLRSPQNLRFRYKLEGFDKEWNNALTRRDISYTNLPAGHFLFRVQAFETNDPGDVSEASLVVVKRPHFYRTWWFTLCVVLTVPAIIFAIHRARMRRLRQKFLAVFEERNRIAREIHDTVIQGCTGVSAALEAVSAMLPPESSLKEDLVDRARIQVRDTIDEARKAVWDLRQKTMPGGDLDTRLSKMSSQITSEFGIPVRCEVRGRPFPTNQSTMHEILMIVREAVHNAVLHGAPSAVELSASFEHDKLKIEIVDDGHGFDPKEVVAVGRKHYGLTGMKERAAKIRGRVEVESAPGKGVHVIVSVPKNKISMKNNITEEGV